MKPVAPIMRTPRHRRSLTPEDEALWRLAVKDIAPLRGNQTRPAQPFRAKKPAAVSLSPRLPDDPPRLTSGAPGQTASESNHQLGRSWHRKLRRGTVPIDSRVDLHGFTREAALVPLHKAMLNAINRDQRCILVITGKGKRVRADEVVAEAGILRREVPRWLRQGSLAAQILAVEGAHPRDGGAGAYYVILRRRRTPPGEAWPR